MSTLLQSSWARRLTAIASAALVCSGGVARATEPTGALLREIGHIDLPGVGGRIDHLAVDLEGQRLFVAALGADEVEVVDLRAGKRVAQLKGLREPQGVVYVQSMRRLFVAAGESGEVVAFDDFVGSERTGYAVVAKFDLQGRMVDEMVLHELRADLLTSRVPGIAAGITR